jgi:hypothetical protein
MILNDQTMKFRERMLEQEKGYELEKAGYTTEAPVQMEEGTPAPTPDITLGKKGYYAPKINVSEIEGLPGYKIVQRGPSMQVVKPEALDVKEKLLKEGLIEIPGIGLYRANKDQYGKIDYNNLTPVATIPKNAPVGSPEWLDAHKQLEAYKAGLKPEKPEKDEAVSDLRKFELVQWGKLRPDMRGTTEYQELYKKFKQSPYTDALERQIELTAKTQGTALRKEFYDSQEVKTYQTMSQQFGVMQEAMKDAKGQNLVAVDQALITVMNKMMDPQSVVRESEYARTPGDLALMNRVKGAYEKLQKGGAGLTDDDRKAIANMGKKYHDVAQKKYKSKYHEYTGYLSNYGLDPEKYLNPSDKGIGASTNPLDKYME